MLVIGLSCQVALQHDRQRTSIGEGGGFENVSPELMPN
jgi:hypothetical protein